MLRRYRRGGRRGVGLALTRVPTRLAKVGGDDVRGAADRREPDVVRVFRRLRDRLTDEAIASMVADPNTVEMLVQQLYEDVRDEVGGALGATASEVAAVEVADLGLQLAFDTVNPKAVAWAATQSNTLVVEITADQVEALRGLITRAVAGGQHPYVVARQIRDVVGLHSRFARAVERYRANLVERGTAASRVDRLSTSYARRLLNLRAKTIARTELMRAANVGQRLAWDEAVRQGFLEPATLAREWMASNDDRIDGTCLDLNGTVVAFAADFPLGDPPVHPMCRCTVGLRQMTAAELARFGS